METVGSGFAAYVDQSIFKRITVLRCQAKHIKQLDQVKQVQQPLLDRDEGNKCFYTAKASAIMGLLLHLLMNVRRRTGKLWTFPWLQHTKEVVLIIPVARKKKRLRLLAQCSAKTKLMEQK